MSLSITGDAQTLVLAQRNLPLLTGDLAGTGGAVGASPDDFVVEEIPLYEPAGHGEHLYLWVEKRGVDAHSLLRQLAQGLGVDARDIGYAGLKDTVAVTRQYVSVPAHCEARLATLAIDRVRVLRVERSDTKLHTGELEGNRFRITVRDCVPDAHGRALTIASRLLDVGVPNYFGSQRFGRDGETLRQGLSILRGGPKPHSRTLLRLMLSAVQSALFNVYLAERLTSGTLFDIQDGEVLQLVGSDTYLVVQDARVEQKRFARHEIVPSGPMFGAKMRWGRGPLRSQEEALLERAGLSLEQFAHFSKLIAGTRRPLLIRPSTLTVTPEGGTIVVCLTLPPGSYATVVLREMTKGELPMVAPERF